MYRVEAPKVKRELRMAKKFSVNSDLTAARPQEIFRPGKKVTNALDSGAVVTLSEIFFTTSRALSHTSIVSATNNNTLWPDFQARRTVKYFMPKTARLKVYNKIISLNKRYFTYFDINCIRSFGFANESLIWSVRALLMLWARTQCLSLRQWTGD